MLFHCAGGRTAAGGTLMSVAIFGGHIPGLAPDMVGIRAIGFTAGATLRQSLTGSGTAGADMVANKHALVGSDICGIICIALAIASQFVFRNKKHVTK